MNICVSAGGTGGHIYPAIAIINKFKEKEKDLNILYIGTHDRMEKDIIPPLGIRYEALEIYGFSKSNIKRDIKNVFLIKKAYDKCIKLFKEFKPDVVIGVGGYVTMPVIAAAHKLGIKTVLHEQNAMPGKTNRYLQKKVDLICTSAESSNKYFNKAKRVIYTGHPCGENALKFKIDKTSIGFHKNKKLLLIVAGSLGSVTVNNFFTKFLSLIKDSDNYEVLYITGKAYYDDFIKDKSFSKNVKIMPFLENLSGLLKDTDLVISRSGAGIISELLFTKTPSIQVPSPYVANNHQYYNALDLKNKNLALLYEEKDLNENVLYNKINELLNESDEYKEMVNNLNNLSLPNASDKIYKSIKDILE